jgi:ribosome modulation factor
VNFKDEDYMSITKAFEEGQEAAELSKSKTDCPYQSDSQQGKDWHEGFDDRNDTNDI